MRIRKHASKILGTASLRPSPSHEPSLAAGPPQATVCELNRSPWDVIPLPLLCPASDDLLADPKEAEEDGVMGNGIKGEEPMSALTSLFGSAAQSEGKQEEHNKGKKEKRRRAKKEADLETSVTATCKKTDGKKWKCKRPAHYPNSFCSYHLAQLRSYSSSSNTYKASAASTARKKRATMNVASVGSDSNYYYYSAFGPWRAKQRRGGDSNSEAAAAVAEEEEEEEVKEMGERDDGDAAAEVHDDEDIGGYDDVSDDDDSMEDEGSDEEENMRREKEKKNPMSSRWKRGRKPVKARSLKSLL